VRICSNFIEQTATRISVLPMQELDHGTRQEIDSIEREALAVFVDGVRVLGLPPSIGEIYGLLFISQAPLSLDDLVKRLKISKGSASQGLRTLKSLGAVRETNGNGNGERRTYYEPAVELKRLVGGFIREQISPHLDSGRHKIKRLGDLANTESDPERRKFLLERTDRLDHWIRNGGRVLPLIQRILGQ
jgi:DNA-binding transcriptional regulator GbsR (MarR family)